MQFLKARLSKIPIHIILIIYSIISIFPLYYVIVTAFKNQEENYYNIYAPPAKWTFINIITLYKEYGFLRSTLNSIIVTSLSILLALVVSVLAAYAYSKMKFKAKELLLSLTVSLTGIPVMIVIIPAYILFSKMSMLDSYIGVSFVYATFMLPFCIFLLTSFFRSIPQELLDAASIDGCNRFQILYKIILPLSKPIITTLIVVNAVWVWNDLLIAMMFLGKPEMTTAAVNLNKIGGRYSTNPVLTQAGALFVVIPMIILFLVGQRYFRRGLFAGAIKE
jgi:raffinose/stachyose/melibiose transport system permease protein